MSGHRLEDEETAALFEAAKQGGEYLDSLKIYDLRLLDKAKLIMFCSIIIAGFAEQRHGRDAKRSEFDDIPMGI